MRILWVGGWEPPAEEKLRTKRRSLGPSHLCFRSSDPVRKDVAGQIRGPWTAPRCAGRVTGSPIKEIRLANDEFVTNGAVNAVCAEQWDENFDIGADTGTPVDDQDYHVPFRFTGRLNKLTLSIDRPKLTPDDEKQLTVTQAIARDQK